MEREYRIYCYTNKITGKKYVGQTCCSLKERAGKNGSAYTRGDTIFGKAIQKYKWENFQAEILEDGITSEQANEREQYWISKLNTIAPNGYNLLPGGNNHSHNELTRRKMSKTRKGHLTSAETRHLIGEAKMGHEVSEETRKKISKALKGTHLSGEIIQKMRETAPLSKPVCQFTLDMKLISEYPSIMEASRQTGIGYRGIGRACSGEYRTAGGYVWSLSN